MCVNDSGLRRNIEEREKTLRGDIYLCAWLQFSANGEQQQQFIPEVELSIMSKMARRPDDLSVPVKGRVIWGGGQSSGDLHSLNRCSRARAVVRVVRSCWKCFRTSQVEGVHLRQVVSFFALIQNDRQNTNKPTTIIQRAPH
jgi:hypothetical protein